MTDVVKTYDSQCATCGKHMEVAELESEEDEERQFEGGCFLGVFSGHQFGVDEELVFYQECKHCCPVCSRPEGEH